MEKLIDISYLVAAVMFIFGLKMLSSPTTARRGNLIASLGMAIAIIATLLSQKILSYELIIIGMVVGSAIGVFFALKVKMTEMPQLVGLLNGFGGFASALVSISEFLRRSAEGTTLELSFTISVALGILIGFVTFTGSLIAAGKLQGVVKEKPVVFPGNQFVNAILFLGAIATGILLAVTLDKTWIMVLSVISLVFGVLLVLPIGGADMPVVISLLNSFSGLAATAAGFVLSNIGLIISGTLVGASGAILTNIMAKAMNRSLFNILFGAFGATVEAGVGKRSVKRYTAEDAAIVLDSANLIIIVPGYGMAVAQAQHAVRELTKLLEERGKTVKFAIHPVAGRMPGHMNVLLSEADIPYSQQFTLEEINPEFEYADVALVVGANDVINPAAKKPGSPIYGMPILEVEKAKTIMIIKRSLSPGFAGIDNELFYKDKTMMVFGDAKEMVTQITQALKNL